MKTVALGTELRMMIGAVLTPIAGIVSITAPSPTRTEIDVTSLDSLAMEFLGGLPDNGELQLNGFIDWEDAGQLNLLARAHQPQSVAIQWELDWVTQGVVMAFQGYVSSDSPAAPGPNDALTWDATIRVTGPVTFTPPLPTLAP